MVKSTSVTARDDQREVNNLPKLHEDQQQGRMLVIDEARSARIAGKVVVSWGESGRLAKIREYLLDVQDFVFRHRGTAKSTVSGDEIEDLKRQVQRALDLT